jgi:hypothetical protein
MSNSRSTQGFSIGPGGEYFIGCLGAAGLIILAAEWIHNGYSPDWIPRGIGFSAAWAGSLSIQALTFFSLRRRLASLYRSLLWAWSLAILWGGFDILLITSGHVYSFLPLVYGVTQIFFVFNLPKTAK